MKGHGIKLLIALLIGYSTREFIEWLGYPTLVGTLVGVGSIVIFYAVDQLILRKSARQP